MFTNRLRQEARRLDLPVIEISTVMTEDGLARRVTEVFGLLAWMPDMPQLTSRTGTPGDALLETTGRRTHLPRRTPVWDGLEGETFWLIAQDGRDADWVRNIKATRRVRVKVSGIHTGRRSGTAHILDMSSLR